MIAFVADVGMSHLIAFPAPPWPPLPAVFLANHLANTDNLISNNQQTEHIQTHTNVITKIGPNKQQYTHSKTYAKTKDRQTDRTWFRSLWRHLARKWVYSFNLGVHTGNTQQSTVWRTLPISSPCNSVGVSFRQFSGCTTDCVIR